MNKEWQRVQGTERKWWSVSDSRVAVGTHLRPSCDLATFGQNPYLARPPGP